MSNINRRKFIGNLSFATAALSIPGVVSACFNKPDDYVIAETMYGKLRGIKSQGVNLFKGIPYAGKISGERRFRRPGTLVPWAGVRDALQLGAPAIQPPNQTYGLNEPKPNEECLFLNIWTPANDNKKRAVMFYNHGGGFEKGSGGSVSQDGLNLAKNFDVVVVETNHRLGLLGFLYLDEIAGADYAGSGNNGTLDIVDALKWVHHNIGNFGGDPNNIMIFGESGGGAKTSCLYAMPSANPYFNKASIESGPGLRMLSKEAASEMTYNVLKELNIAAKDWRKILDVPTSDLLTIQQKFNFKPVVDGGALPQDPFYPSAPAISKNKPLMVGWNEDEYTFFAMASNDTEALKPGYTFDDLSSKLKGQFGSNTKKIIDTYRHTMPAATASDIWVAITSINMMGLGSVKIAELKAVQHGAAAYLYNFGYKSEAKVPGTDYPFGTPHAMDISFKFNNEIPGSKPGFLSGNKPERFKVSHDMAALWTSFAKTGKPTATDVPEWRSYNLKDRPTMRIDVKCEVVNNRFAEELRMWRGIGKL